MAAIAKRARTTVDGHWDNRIMKGVSKEIAMFIHVFMVGSEGERNSLLRLIQTGEKGPFGLILEYLPYCRFCGHVDTHENFEAWVAMVEFYDKISEEDAFYGFLSFMDYNTAQFEDSIMRPFKEKKFTTLYTEMVESGSDSKESLGRYASFCNEQCTRARNNFGKLYPSEVSLKRFQPQLHLASRLPTRPKFQIITLEGFDPEGDWLGDKYYKVIAVYMAGDQDDSVYHRKVQFILSFSCMV